MKSISTLLILLSSIIFLPACENGQCCTNKSVQCQGYQDVNGKAWIPYRTKQKLIFATLAGERDTLSIDSTALTDPFVEQEPCAKTRCRATLLAISGYDSIYSREFYFSHQTTGVDTLESSDITLGLRGTIFYGTKFGNQGIANPATSNCMCKVQFYAQTTLNNQAFTAVQEITADTTCIKTALQIRRVYLAKNKGIVGYQTNSDGKLWVLQ